MKYRSSGSSSSSSSQSYVRPLLQFKNSHERAKEESNALAKSSVLSMRRNAATETVGHRGVIPSTSST